MQSKPDLPLEIYHRIYRLANQKVDAQRIAATLNLPLKAVQNVLHRLNAAGDHTATERDASKAGQAATPSEDASFLDIYVYQKTRYTVVDLSGMVTQDHCPRLQAELTKLIQSGTKTVAIMISDVRHIDKTGLDCLAEFNNAFKAKGRFAAILDPPRELEPFIEQNRIEEIIPIYGTEKTFEDKAFAVKKDTLGKQLK